MTLDPIANVIGRLEVKKRFRSEDRFRSARRRAARLSRRYLKGQLVFDWYSSVDRRGATQ